MSSGPDGISCKVLRNIDSLIVKPLTFLINFSVCSGKFPNELKLSKIIPVYKKKDRTNVENW